MDDDTKAILNYSQACDQVQAQQYVIIRAVMSSSWRNHPDAYASRIAVESARLAQLLGKVKSSL